MIDTIVYSWCDGYSTNTKFLWGGGIRIEVQVSRKKLYTHVHLN